MLGGVRNPFQLQSIADPWSRVDSDVSALYQALLDQAADLIVAVQLRSQTSCLLIEGESGVGKTHFSARFRAHVLDREEPSYFFSVPCEVAPSRIWRHLRQCMVDCLLRQGPRGTTLLSRLIGQRDLAAASATISYNLATVLGHYRADHYRAWCTAWLRGEPLPDKATAKLEVSETRGNDRELEEQSRQVVLELARLASPGVAVFCFDRIEALEYYPGSTEGLAAFETMFLDLAQSLANGLILSCLQPGFVAKLPPALKEAMAENRALLKKVGPEQAEYLLRTAMDWEPQIGVARTRESGHTLWPLPAEFLTELGTPAPWTPRYLLAKAEQAFETWRSPAAVAGTADVRAFLESEYVQRLEAGLANPALDSDAVFLAAMPVLLAPQGRRGTFTREHPSIDFTVETPGAPIAVCMVNQVHEPDVAQRLREISDTWNAREFARLRLVRDARLPFHGGGKPAQEALKGLRTRGAKLVRPSTEAIAALEAARSLYADAQTGHLYEKSGEAVAPQAVLDWLSKHAPLILQELASEVLETGSEDTQFAGGLLEYLQKKSIVKLEDAADAVGASAEEVAAYARSHPSRIGYLAGPPQVLFHPVAARARPEVTAD
ncbi:hypothetical protein F183_A26830 [Bryobacterales bacterium F-183]|nr:hypothetical protein F183_A26830 [Bryobacterales bacterium F-183]